MSVEIDAVVFDLDGVLIQTEEIWDEVRGDYVVRLGGRYDDEAQRAMMGMSSKEWSLYLVDDLGVPRTAEQVNADIVELMAASYREHLPLIAGAKEAVERLAGSFALAVASSSNRPLIDLVLEISGLERFFAATVSAEEVRRGKPAPDVYLEACRRLELEPGRAAAVEDSHAGIASARAAGMRVIAIPNPAFPPGEEALADADVVLGSLGELTRKAVESSSGKQGLA